MKIFYVAEFDCSLARIGGEAGHVRGIVRSLSRDGHEVFLFAGGWTPNRDETIRFFPVPQVKIPGFYAISFGILCLPIVLWALVQHKPRVIVSRYYKFVLPLLILARFFQTPMFLEVNSDISSERRVSNGGPVRNAFEAMLEEQSYRLATGIIAVSDSVVDSIRKRFPHLTTPIKMIPNGVDTEIYFPRVAAECRKMLGLEPDRQYIVFSGAFQRYQGLPTLFDALFLLTQKIPNICLLLAGDGPDRTVVEENLRSGHLEKHCHFFGWSSELETAVILGASDICVAPYNLLAAGTTEPYLDRYGAHLRGSPLKIYTYLASGRPVVASHFKEAGVFVSSIGAGVAVPPENAEALANAVESLLRDPHTAKLMGEAGRTAVCANHSWDTTSRRMLRFLTQTATLEVVN
jgi:glycosyltransferase involved in cell wall biosynthesis